MLACIALCAFLQAGLVSAQTAPYSISFTISQVSGPSEKIVVPSTGFDITYSGVVQDNYLPKEGTLSGKVILYVKIDGQAAKQLGTDITVNAQGSFSYSQNLKIYQENIYASAAKLYVVYRTAAGVEYKSSTEYTIERATTTTPPPPPPPTTTCTDPAIPANQPRSLVAIRKSGTASGKTELYKTAFCDGVARTRTFVTILPPTNEDWEFKIADWNNDGTVEMIGIKKSNTVSGLVEMNVVSGASNYTSYLLQKNTAFQASGNWEFEISDYDNDAKLDLVGILRNNTGSGKAEIHVARQANNFSQITDSRSTAFPMSLTDWEYEVLDYDNDGSKDIVGLKKNNTGTGKTEIHVATFATLYGSLTHSRATAFPLSTAAATWEFDVVDHNGDGQLDVAGVKKNGTGTGTSEFHMVSGAELYQNIRFSTHTTFPQTDNTWEFCYLDVTKKIAGGRIATSGDNLSNSAALFTAYPNPTSDVLVVALNEATIAKGEPVEAKLFNARSMVVKTTNKIADGKMVMAVKELPSGLYYIQVQAGRETIKKKVVILHQ